MVVLRQKWLYSGKVVVFRQKILYSGKEVAFGQKWFHSGRSRSTRAKLMLFGQLLYSDKSGSIPAEVVLFGQKWLYLGKVVVFRQGGCTRAKRL